MSSGITLYSQSYKNFAYNTAINTVIMI